MTLSNEDNKKIKIQSSPFADLVVGILAIPFIPLLTIGILLFYLKIILMIYFMVIGFLFTLMLLR